MVKYVLKINITRVDNSCQQSQFLDIYSNISQICKAIQRKLTCFMIKMIQLIKVMHSVSRARHVPNSLFGKIF